MPRGRIEEIGSSSHLSEKERKPHILNIPYLHVKH